MVTFPPLRGFPSYREALHPETNHISMKPTRSFLPIGAALSLALIPSSAQAVVLASYNLNTTTRLTATSVAPNVSASSATLSGQTEDLTAPVADNQYYFDTGGMDINRGGTSWGDFNSPKMSFTIGAPGATSVTVESVTLTTGANTHNFAFQLGTATGVSNFTSNGPTISTGGGTATSTLTTPFEIAAGGSRTFYLMFNSANTNSTHQDIRFTVNGIPEPSSALLGGLGLLVLLRRRR